MVGVVGLAVGLGPVQHIAVDTVGGELRLEVAVVGAVAQGLVAVGHRPLAGVLRGELLPGHCLNDHGGGGGAASGAADGGILAGDPVGLVLPPGVGLEVADGFRHTRSDSRRGARAEPKKSRHFRVRSRDVEL